VNECVLHGNLAKEKGSLAMGAGQKKPTWWNAVRHSTTPAY
jgi:hypothetical protein